MLSLLGLLTSAGTVTGAPVSNPIAPGSADPWVVCYQGQYYYTCTTARNITLWTAPRLSELGLGEGRVVFTPPEGTAYSHNLWAPELHQWGDRWLIYFAADDGQDRNHRMYVLGSEGSDPMGPYNFLGKISTQDDQWAIDGSVFEWQGERYFCWSGWDAPPRHGQRLYLARMTSPTTLAEPRVEISEPDLPWELYEYQVNEGAQVIVSGGTVHIFYSANPYWRVEYCLGRLTLRGDDPLAEGAWEKAPWPVFWRANGVDGVGHGCFFTSPDGTETWVAYHGHHGERRGNWIPRDFRAQPIAFDANGYPVLGEPVASGKEIPPPSGELP